MKSLLKSACCLGLFCSFAGLSLAADVDGILIDKMCSAKALSGGQKAAMEHDRDCALTAGCQKSGYGVYTSDGKFLSLDAAGNTKAIAALKASKKKDNLTVKITGDIQGDSINVTNLKLQ
jgi:hypothetical protein